jgi:hypothetical protein
MHWRILRSFSCAYNTQSSHQLCEQVLAFWLTPMSYEAGQLLLTNPYVFYSRMREEDSSKASLAEFGLIMHACCATEMNCERILGDVARLVGKDRASLNNETSVKEMMLQDVGGGGAIGVEMLRTG